MEERTLVLLAQLGFKLKVNSGNGELYERISQL